MVGGALGELSEEARSSNDPVFFSHGAQCGAQTTTTIEFTEGVTVEEFFRNRLEHGPGLHDSIANYIDNGDGTITLIHSHPGMTCDALTLEASYSEADAIGRATAIEYGLIAALIATCDDTVVEPLTKSTPDDDYITISNGDNWQLLIDKKVDIDGNMDSIRDEVVDIACVTQAIQESAIWDRELTPDSTTDVMDYGSVEYNGDGLREEYTINGVDDDCDGIIEDEDTISSEVMLETGLGDVSERDAVVAGTVGGTTFTLSAIYAHWRSARASRL
jgi:hypothetical protein